MFLKFFLTLGFSVIVLSGCFHSKSEASYVDVYKHDGSLQCDLSFDKTGSIEAMRLELINADVDVVSNTCGVDGMNRIAMCGSETGKINIYRIRSVKVVDAEGLGYRKLSGLGDHVILECPGV